jgi:hypothetical protein
MRLFLPFLACILSFSCKKEETPQEETYDNLCWTTPALTDEPSWDAPPILSDDYVILQEREFDFLGIPDGSEVLRIKALGEVFQDHFSLDLILNRAYLLGDNRVLCFQL